MDAANDALPQFMTGDLLVSIDFVRATPHGCFPVHDPRNIVRHFAKLLGASRALIRDSEPLQTLFFARPCSVA